MNNNYQEYDFSMESLLLRCNKPFHFFSKDTHITFLLINFYDKRRINMNWTVQIIRLIRSCLVSLILTPFTLTKWLTQFFADSNKFDKSETKEVCIE